MEVILKTKTKNEQGTLITWNPDGKVTFHSLTNFIYSSLMTSSPMCCKALVHLSPQEVKSCKTSIEQNFSQSQLFQPGHKPRLDLHTTLEPGSEILQDSELSKSSSKSLTLQLGQELQQDLNTVKSLEYYILQPLEYF